MENPLDALIIGAGISGLACLWRLRRLGFDAVCVEASERVGGSIRSRRRDGFLVEGAASGLHAAAELLELVHEVGLADEIVPAPPRLPRFIYRQERLHPAPLAAAGLLSTRLLSLRGKGRLLGELWVAPRPDGGEESIDSFFARRFGREAAEAIVAPFVSGTFAGDAVRLSVHAVFPALVELEARFGGVIRGLLRRGRDGAGSAPRARTVISFRDGLETLCRRIHQRLGDGVQLGVRAERIERAGCFRVSLRAAGGTRTVAARAVVLAAPPAAAAVALGALAPDAGRALGEIEGPPLACVSLAWPRSRVEHPLAGFGFLVAPGEPARILGCFWGSSLFPDRAPPDHVALTSFVGGSRDPEGGLLDDAPLVDAVSRDLARIVGARGRPRVVSIDRHAQAIPQYAIGHTDRVRRIRAGLDAVPGLFVTGNYLGGIGVGDCVRQAGVAAAAVGAFLRSAAAVAPLAYR